MIEKKIFKKFEEKPILFFLLGISSGILPFIFALAMVTITKYIGGISNPRSALQHIKGELPEKKASQYELVSSTPEEFQYKKQLIIMTAEVVLDVISFQKTYDEIMKLVQKYEGFIADSSEYLDEEGRKSGTIVVRVPQKNFYNLLSLVEKLGYCRSKNIKGEDITEEYIDLEMRVRNLKKEEEQLLNIMEKANKVKDILEVAKELSRVRGEIEQITGRIKYLENRVKFSTITVQIKEKIIQKIPSLWNIGDTFKNAVNSLLKVIRAFLSLIIWILVFLPLLILIALIWNLIKKTKNKFKK
jgi:hypothetical protein